MKLSCSRMLIAALAFLFVTAETRADFSDGLVSNWTFDGNLSDSVGPNNGTFSGTAGAAYDTGKFGQGIDLDGVDQYVNAGSNASLDPAQGSGSITISAWFRVDSFDVDWQALISKGEGTAYRIARRGGETGIGYAGGSGEGPGISAAVDDGALHQVVAISDEGNNTRLWLDGQFVTYGPEPNITAGTNNFMDALFIGANPGADPLRYWNGLIDDVAIWDRALSAPEVDYLWNDGDGVSIADAASAGVEFLVGDVNLDNVVDLVDYGFIRDNLGDPGVFADGDLNEDGNVTMVDFGIWKDNAPAAIANGVTIPEPSTFALALLAGLLAASRLRTRS